MTSMYLLHNELQLSQIHKRLHRHWCWKWPPCYNDYNDDDDDWHDNDNDDDDEHTLCKYTPDENGSVTIDYCLFTSHFYGDTYLDTFIKKYI